MKIEEDLGRKRDIARILHSIGNVHRKLKDYQKAIEYLNRSLDIAMEIGAKDIVINSYSSLIKAHSAINNGKEALAYFELYNKMIDSLHSEQGRKQLAELQTKYETEKKERENRLLKQEKEIRILKDKEEAALAERQKAEKSRRDNLQYSGILIFLVLVFAAVFTLGKISIPIRLAEGLIFFSFLLFFEFTLVLLDPYIERYSSGAPVVKLGFNALLAGLIFPLHSFFESRMKRRLVK